jgi:hypothetical protein
MENQKTAGELGSHGIDAEEALTHYIICAIWSSNDDRRDPEGHGCPLDRNYGPEDLSPETRASMAEDVSAFIEANADDLTRYLEGLGYGPEQIGHDFWLTRNGHGAGFWDRYYGTDSELRACVLRLSDAAKGYGSSDLYVGDDGKVWVS